jgi:hypothetical protein
MEGENLGAFVRYTPLRRFLHAPGLSHACSPVIQEHPPFSFCSNATMKILFTIANPDSRRSNIFMTR